MTRTRGTGHAGWPTIAGLVFVLFGGIYLCTVPGPASPVSTTSTTPAVSSQRISPAPPRYVPAPNPGDTGRVGTPAAGVPDNGDLAPLIDLDTGGGDDDDHHRHDDRDSTGRDGARDDDNFGRDHHHLLTND